MADANNEKIALKSTKEPDTGDENEAGDKNRNSQDHVNKSDEEKSLTGRNGEAASKTKTPTFVFMLSLLATIGGFLFGYDIGIVAGSMLFIQPYFELSIMWQEAIVSGTIAAAAVAALMAGWLTDKIGRKLTIMTSSVVFTIGGISMGVAPSKEVLLLGRIISGLGVGLASVVVPVYVAESSPVHIRGRLVSMHQAMINTGIVVSSFLAGAFSYVKPDGWRYMLGMAAVPGVIQFIGFLFMPESPRWLVDRGRFEQAKKVLGRMRGSSDIDKEFKEILQTVEEAKSEKAGGIYHLIKIFKTSHVRRATLIGCALLCFQQWCGINTVIYYSGTVLKMAGFPVKYAIWLVTVPNIVLFLSNLIGLYLVERIGRRPLVIGSLAGTIVGLIILAVGFQLSAESIPSLSSNIVEVGHDGTMVVPCHSIHRSCESCVRDNSCGYCYSNSTDGTCLPSVDEEYSSVGRCNRSENIEYSDMKWAYEYCPSDYTWIILFGMAVFVFAFSPGLGPMPWTINAEIYPLWARSTSNSIAACTAWVCNLIISFSFLTMTEHITIQEWSVSTERYRMFYCGAYKLSHGGDDWIQCTYPLWNYKAHIDFGVANIPLISCQWYKDDDSDLQYDYRCTFWLFAAISACGVVVLFVFLPETKDKTLEEIEQLFMTPEQREHLAARRMTDMDKFIPATT